MENTSEIVSYTQLTSIKLKSFFSRRMMDPSVDVEREANAFISSQKVAFNEKVANSFDIESEEFQKFEFFTVDQRAEHLLGTGETINGNTELAFRSRANVSILYLKARSVIIFTTRYDFAVTKPGCFGNGGLYYSGGRNYDLEEIYFNKISNVGTHHTERSIRVYQTGCFGGSSATFNHEENGFVIRAGENFRIFASERNAEELKDARKMINEKISETN